MNKTDFWLKIRFICLTMNHEQNNSSSVVQLTSCSSQCNLPRRRMDETFCVNKLLKNLFVRNPKEPSSECSFLLPVFCCHAVTLDGGGFAFTGAAMISALLLELPYFIVYVVTKLHRLKWEIFTITLVVYTCPRSHRTFGLESCNFVLRVRRKILRLCWRHIWCSQ